jgi:peptidoglycan hydrolase-like protein with peptidoglycan-binding domain
VRNSAARAGRGKSALVDDEIDGRRGRYLFRALGWSRRDAVGFMVGAVATIAILINVLLMQSGSHPAPMFKNAPVTVKPVAVTDSIPATVPRPRPVEPAPAKVAAPPAPRTPGEIINDIQRELARRGYYDGAVDGLYGPRTDTAIRDFEQAAALKPSTEPNEALLQAIVRAPAKLAKVAPAAPPAAAPPAARPAPVRNELMPEKPVPSKRVIALQRALADYGYGQIKPSGIVDAETQAAIEKFERERKLPVTGQPSDRVTRELSSMTGRPLD